MTVSACRVPPWRQPARMRQHGRHGHVRAETSRIGNHSRGGDDRAVGAQRRTGDDAASGTPFAHFEVHLGDAVG